LEGIINDLNKFSEINQSHPNVPVDISIKNSPKNEVFVIDLEDIPK
jgi:hypothetical protein